MVDAKGLHEGRFGSPPETQSERARILTAHRTTTPILAVMSVDFTEARTGPDQCRFNIKIREFCCCRMLLTPFPVDPVILSNISVELSVQAYPRQRDLIFVPSPSKTHRRHRLLREIWLSSPKSSNIGQKHWMPLSCPIIRRAFRSIASLLFSRGPRQSLYINYSFGCQHTYKRFGKTSCLR